MIWSCNEWLKKTYAYNDGNFLVRPRAYCKDGFSISIQASEFHYCSPRVMDDGPYTKVELGYPNEPELILSDYRENLDDDYTSTVYPYVPVEIVDEIIKKHGGIEDGRIEN